MSTVRGTLIWREAHCGPEECLDFRGSPAKIFAALVERDMAGCGCCRPAFTTAAGLRCEPADGGFEWSLTAAGSEAMGMSYMARHIGKVAPS